MKLLKSLAVLMMAWGSWATAEELPKPVKLILVDTRPVILERQFFGQVAARQSVDLAFQVGGQIVEFPVNEGGTIPAGDLIAQLDQEKFELELAQARLQKDQADRTVARLQKLKGTTVSQVALDDAETQSALADIALRNAEWALRHATLSAPFDGLISSRNVERYSTVSSGTPVVRIHDMSELRIEVDVPEILFQRAGDEQNVTINVSFPTGPQEYPLEIREFVAETSNVGQTFHIAFGMELPEGLNILPGSSATVNVKVAESDVAIELPPTALVANGAGDIGVMVFSPTGADSGSVAWTAVETTPTQSGNVRILSGLPDGAEVVATGGGALDDGQSVRRFTGFGN